MLRCLGLLLVAAVAGGMSGHVDAASIDLGRIFGAGKDAVTAVTGVEEKDEIEIGREIAGRTLGAAQLVNDPELQAYVNSVGRWIASQAERPDLPWRFGVMDNGAINAFAAPGGFILITRGLYEILDTEAQLAGVLGHEIGHVVKRHHITVMQKSAGLSAVAQLAQRDNRSAIINNLIGTGAEIFARGLDKDAEFEADQIGVILAARAGYSPYGLIEVLHKFAARGMGGDASLALLFETHPQPNERLQKLGEALEPRVPTLPAGKEPVIRQVSSDVPPPPAAAAQPVPAGARALQPADGGGAPVVNPRPGGTGVNPGSILKGIFGR